MTDKETERLIFPISIFDAMCFMAGNLNRVKRAVVVQFSYNGDIIKELSIEDLVENGESVILELNDYDVSGWVYYNTDLYDGTCFTLSNKIKL